MVEAVFFCQSDLKALQRINKARPRQSSLRGMGRQELGRPMSYWGLSSMTNQGEYLIGMSVVSTYVHLR